MGREGGKGPTYRCVQVDGHEEPFRRVDRPLYGALLMRVALIRVVPTSVCCVVEGQTQRGVWLARGGKKRQELSSLGKSVSPRLHCVLCLSRLQSNLVCLARPLQPLILLSGATYSMTVTLRHPGSSVNAWIQKMDASEHGQHSRSVQSFNDRLRFVTCSPLSVRQPCLLDQTWWRTRSYIM